MGECVRSGFCNFMHLKPISRELRRELYGRHNSRSSLGPVIGGGVGPGKQGSRDDFNSRRRSRSRSRGGKR